MASLTKTRHNIALTICRGDEYILSFLSIRLQFQMTNNAGQQNKLLRSFYFNIENSFFTYRLGLL